ncbi:hypothetical protein [Roseibium sp.]|nr:hypothetical protein [Roseibium sp.]
MNPFSDGFRIRIEAGQPGHALAREVPGTHMAKNHGSSLGDGVEG